MFMCVTAIDFAYVYKIFFYYYYFWNCSGSMVFFFSSFVLY
jgi:hypothetical protein